MFASCARRRVPRAGVDPIRDELDALALLSLVVDTPPTHQVLAIILDGRRIGRSVVAVHDTFDDDAVLHLADFLASGAAAAPGTLHHTVLASVRPGRTLEPGDGDRWLEASHVLERAGVVLLEWFVVGRQLSRPRDHLGVPPRWSGAVVPDDP